MKSVSRYLTPWRVTVTFSDTWRLRPRLVMALQTLPCVTWKCEPPPSWTGKPWSWLGRAGCTEKWVTDLLMTGIQFSWCSPKCWLRKCKKRPPFLSPTFVHTPILIRNQVSSEFLSFHLGMQVWYLPHQYIFMRWCWFQHNLEWILLASRGMNPDHAQGLASFTVASF